MTTTTTENKALCLIFPGGTESEILSAGDYCIPYLTKKGVLKAPKVVKRMNRLLAVCKRGITIILA